MPTLIPIPEVRPKVRPVAEVNNEIEELIKALNINTSGTNANTKALDANGNEIYTNTLATTINTDALDANTNALRVLSEQLNPYATEASGEKFTEKVFNVVKGVRENLEELKSYVEKFSREKNPSTASLFEMEFKVIQFQLSLDVASKFGDKASQAFQTLFRNQG